ncbi:MAG TPA: hypothetical protein VL971_00690 [Rhizomicrobium sp.]|nr:hypothetical protein [Rhizomicrobium sp.]
MTPVSQQSLQTQVTTALIFVGFVFSLAANLPGHLSYDSVVELLEGRAAAYAGWHPPMVSWLLGVLDAILPGTALFVVLNTLLIYGSLYLLLKFVPTPSWAAAVLAALFALTPQYMNYPGIVWKDILFAAVSVTGFVALGVAAVDWPRPVRRTAWLLTAFGLLVVSALARQNGIVVMLTGVAAFGWIAARQGAVTVRRLAIFGGSAFLAAIVAFTVANVALGTRLVQETGAVRQLRLLELYDTIAMLAGRPDMQLRLIDSQDPALGNALRTEGLRLYTPQRNDPLAASQPLQDAVADAPDDLLRDQWLSLIVHHPLLYLETRSDIFGWVLLTPRIDLCVPTYSGVSGPPESLDDLDLQARFDDRDLWLELYGDRFMGTPVLQHGIFALLSMAAAVLLLWRRRAADIAIAFLQIGALVYTATFFFISIACDYRYLYFLDLAAMTGWFAIAVDWRWWKDRWRLWRSG